MHEPTSPSSLADSDAERIRESERRRIARDLHDDLGSHLTAIKMALAQLSTQLAASGAEPVLHAQTLRTDRLIDHAIDAMHNVIDDLYPPVLDLGLRAGLEWLASDFSRQSGISCHLYAGEELPPSLLDNFQIASLYRIAREALHNISRHAAASEVDIGLQLADRCLTLDINDNGIGLPDYAGTLPDATGLRGMRARAAAAGAALMLSSLPGNGTRIVVKLLCPDTANPIK